MSALLPEQSRRLLGQLLAAYREQEFAPISSVYLSFLTGLSEDEVNAICRELEETHHVQGAGAPGYWIPDLDRAERDGLFEPLAATVKLKAGPRGRLSADLAERQLNSRA